MKTSFSSGRVWIALSTMAVVGLIFAYYFLVYVPEKESQLVSKKYRVLQRMARNFFEMKENYQNSVKLLLSRRQLCPEEESINKILASRAGGLLTYTDQNQIAGLSESLRECHRQQAQRLQRDLDNLHVEPFQIELDPYDVGTRRSVRSRQLTASITSRTKEKNYVMLQNMPYRVRLANLIVNPDVIDNQFDRFLIVRLFTTKRKWMPKKQPLSSDSVISTVAYQGRKFEAMNGADNKILLDGVGNLFDSLQVFKTIPTHTVRISGTRYRLFSYVMEMENDEDWVLCGLIKESRIQQGIRQIDLFLIIIISLLALFVLLAMPVMKLLIMNSIERLQILNVWFMGYSIVIGTALVTVLFLVGHHYLSYRDTYEHQLEQLSSTIVRNFNTEIESIVNQMKRIDQPFVNTYKLTSGRTQVSYVLADKAYEKFTASLPYKFFNEIILLNEQGKAPTTFATHHLPDPLPGGDLPDLSKRRYFSEPVANNLTSLVDKDVEPFYIQSIRSWNSGMNEAGISILANLTLAPGKPSAANTPVATPAHATANPPPKPAQTTDLKVTMKRTTAAATKPAATPPPPKPAPTDSASRVVVIATATKLKSVTTPLLLPGFQFCIVDHAGEVLFHSDADKILQENFFDEIDDSYLAKAAISGRMSTHMELTFSGKKYLAYVRPLDTKSMYLITLLDKDYYDTPIILTVGFVFILITIMFVAQGLQLSFLFGLTYRSSKLRIKRFHMNWLRPRSDAESQTGYAKCISAMFVAGIPLVIVCAASSARYLAVSFLTLPILLLTFHYVLLYRVDPENNTPKDRVVFALFGMLLYAIFTFVAVQHMPVAVTSGADGRLLLLQVGVAALVWLNAMPRPFGWLHRFVARLFPVHGMYMAFLTLWLVLVSVLPVYYFYKAAYFHEKFLWGKFLQWEAYQNRLDREAALQKEFQKLDFLEAPQKQADYNALRNTYLAACDALGNYLDCDGTITQMAEKTIPESDHLEDGIIEKIEFRLRPPFYGPLENSRQVLLNGQNAARWYARASRDNIIIGEQEKIFYSSAVKGFSLWKGYGTLPLILAYIIVCLLIYRLILIAVKYIYGWGLLGLEANPAGNNNPTIMDMLANGSNRIFVVSLPHANNMEILNPVKTAYTVKEISLRTQLNDLPSISQPRFLMIHHFEHGLNDVDLNTKRLKLFVDAQELPNMKIVVTSTVQPELILDILEAKIKRLTADKRTEEKDKAGIQLQLNRMRNDYRVWKNILAGFEIYYTGLARQQGTTLVDQELCIGTFLPRLAIHYNANAPDADNDETILSIEERATAYYQGLWNSFTRTEKNKLYDLAKDRFVNLRDLSKIRLLIKKGVIVMDDSPRIMNKSFNNFILSVVKEDEELAMTNELRRKGAWSSVQLILIIALVSVTVFIAVVQQEVLSSINALIATVSGVIALLLRFSGFFSNNKPKEPV